MLSYFFNLLKGWIWVSLVNLSSAVMEIRMHAGILPSLCETLTQ